MTLARQGDPSTSLEVLFGTAENAPEALVRDIHASGAGRILGRALEVFPQATRQAAVRDAAAAAATLLDADLIGVLADGWRKQRDLTAAARRTLAVPGSSELVSLAGHQITMTQQPSVDVLIDRQVLATVELGLSLVFDVKALVAGIKAGRLTAIHAGYCDVTATLAIQAVPVLVRPARIQLPGVITFTRAVQLLSDIEYSAAAEDQAPPLAAETASR